MRINDRKKGVTLEDAVSNAFKPEPAPKQQPAQPGMPEVPAAPEPTAGGQVPELPQGRPAMQELLAGLTGGGDPNLSARITRQIPA